MQADPTRFLSGSDDCTVRLWSLHDPAAAAVIDAKANVCSVQFSPSSSHLIAFGSANYRVYIYDLRALKARAAPHGLPGSYGGVWVCVFEQCEGCFKHVLCIQGASARPCRVSHKRHNSNMLTGRAGAAGADLWA